MGQVYAVWRLIRTCHPLIGDKRASQDRTAEACSKRPLSGLAGPGDRSKVPYRIWHPWAAGSTADGPQPRMCGPNAVTIQLLKVVQLAMDGH